MSKIKKRPIFPYLLKRMKEPRRFMQVLLGPRQVGKTTLALQVAEAIGKPVHYISADLATLQDLTWLEKQWEIARYKIDKRRGGILIIDEVQKIPYWSQVIKSLWDSDTKQGIKLNVMILGSSPWLMQKGLTESLGGRFEIIPITHWSFQEMQDVFGWSLDKFIYFGGYPGSAEIANEKEPSRWSNYINDALIETTISRDILLMTQVNKPALLRRLFQLGCMYSGQILSFTKMLGQLQDAGNTTTLAHYLELLTGAGLIAGIEKFSKQNVRQKNSSPKLCVYNTALTSAQCSKTFAEAKKDREFWGRLVESAVGAYLLNSIRGSQIELFYWREGDLEVDFVLQKGGVLIALEVKSNNESLTARGIEKFVKKFNPSKLLLVGKQGIPLEEFLTTPVSSWF